ncbi:MAG: hypothetical protein ACRDPT_11115 [Streptomycetales bacterium]
MAASTVSTLRRARHAYTHQLSVHQQTALISWLAFLGTFGGVRALTYAIRDRVRPFTDVHIGELHIHHYLWGICLLAGVGTAALYGDQRPGPHPLIATAYGTGGALIVDEFALLLDLQDVYWARQGRWSVDLGVGIAAAAGSYFAAVPFWRRLLHRG